MGKASGETAAGTGEGAPEAAEATLSYEQAREELAAVVRRLEGGGLSLEESLRLWQRGEDLATTCEQWLEGARAKLAAALAERTEPDDGAEAPF
ncbi:exodeoxyribonuclease VII small subunit [Allonocardiopsis opalescens]|uniref:Exodeoxyribonuclease 7 small subunit n=1 Tax=Allonocardiopsis opalescens TaxID=1144618 RepID=A0A2T0QDH1_9ACTN|nr:exodeoxyribonuclease VII small subunit [Allonocardiopsis opalescens]PRY01920.1 exodeoxyribonuclease VII small subunit [Allonocardiopsis opalescens]